ncbi:hypothetical protein [Saccharothrix deserti]|uniref:hypothetical protein n=1 Tax=Saccharothrix deserti TaxID=2593674 RepID=UPI00131BDB59|nr:hypothetical protein [Saccharothrix deserti]
MPKVDEYPVKTEIRIPRGEEFQKIMTVLDRIHARSDGYVLTVRSRRVFRAVGLDAMRPATVWETAAVHQLGNRGLIFLVPQELVLRSGAVRARVNLLLLTESGFEVAEAYRELTGRSRCEEEGVDGRKQQAG